jgi:hypothetical protein
MHLQVGLSGLLHESLLKYFIARHSKSFFHFWIAGFLDFCFRHKAPEPNNQNHYPRVFLIDRLIAGGLRTPNAATFSFAY